VGKNEKGKREKRRNLDQVLAPVPAPARRRRVAEQNISANK